MKKTLSAAIAITLCIPTPSAIAQQIQPKPDSQTGAIGELTIGGDKHNMSWILKADGSQYPWVTDDYGWGLGYFTETSGGKKTKALVVRREWKTPAKLSADGMTVSYHEGNVRIDVERRIENNDLVEKYAFTNAGQEAVFLSDVGIYTPFNDNYPDAPTCINLRTNAHIWEGGSAAYVNALRMGGFAPHLGLVLTAGAVQSYEVWERGTAKAYSQFRGVIALNPPDIFLKKGETYSLEWRLFSHSGNEDFQKKLLDYGSALASANKYVFEKGETARVELRSGTSASVTAKKNGVPIPVRREGEVWLAETLMEQAGEVRFDFCYGKGKQTHVSCLVIGNAEDLVRKRIDFIVKNQQMNNPADPRDGAYMVYDNETDSIYLNNTPSCSPADRDEGAERMGMGVLLAKQYLLTKEPRLKESLLRYAKLARERLQTKDYLTYSNVNQTSRNRGYNYMWAAMFYFEMYGVTGDKLYVEHGYQTLQAMYRKFGYGFYAIHIPVRLGLQSLKQAGMAKEYEDLMSDFVQTGDIFIKNGLNYPKHEVNYEQSIVAPAVSFLSQLYLETGTQKYLDEAKRQITVLEAFNGLQPSFHKNDIAIRHWDGYWFGKHEMYGDVFPHYWSVLTGEAFHFYALCTGETSYQRRAENIVRNNLCLFFEDGTASCAYMYPYKVNGVKAQFYDPYANDQDWALVSLLTINN
jgi:hypothetical protein